jgi:oxygen-independent coproporphyrinogen-3 oxidase
VSGTDDYVARVGAGEPAEVERRELTRSEQLEEALFTGLRLSAGVNIEEVGRRHGADVWRRYGDALAPFLADGLLQRDGAVLRLTRRGMLLANEIMSVFV